MVQRYSSVPSGFSEQSLLITEVDGAITAGEVKEHLSSLLDEESTVWLIQSEGRPVSLPLYELDRKKKYDHMTAVLVPGSDFLHRCRNTIDDLLKIMERLRAPDGCPWDSIQTHESLRPYMVEEAWEAVNAIDDNDPPVISKLKPVTRYMFPVICSRLQNFSGSLAVTSRKSAV